MTDADRLRAEIARLGRTQRGLARELGLDERLVRRYCSGDLEVPPIVWAALRGLQPIATAHYTCGCRTVGPNVPIVCTLHGAPRASSH